MSPGNPKGVLIAMLLAPIVCCFIGVGVFLHVVVSMAQSDEQAKANLRARQQAIVADSQTLEKELEVLQRRIEELRKRLVDAQATGETVRQLERELNLLLAQKAELESRLAQLRQELAQTQGSVTKAERDAQKLTGEAKQARAKIEQTQRQVAAAQAKLGPSATDPRDPFAEDVGPATGSQQLQGQLDAQRSALAASERELERLNSELGQLMREREENDKTFELKPLKGTRRWNAPQAVYVECNGSGVTILPAGTTFATDAPADQEQPFLEQATRTGYVLFLIRPSGFASFTRYRDLLTAKRGSGRNRLDFGYEPVNEDWLLILPKAGS